MSTAPAGAPSEGASARARAARIEAMVFVGLLVVLSIAVLIATTTIREPPGSTGTLGARATPLGAAQLTMFRKHFSRDLSDMLAVGAVD